MAKPRLTHLDEAGAARMVDVSDKHVTSRTATAGASIWMAPETLRVIVEGEAKKGDVLAVARIAGIMAAKRTHDLIPLCHQLPITKVEVAFEPVMAPPATAEARLDVTATVKVDAKTGVEMEALTAVSVACLTVYDMLKAIDRAMRITDIRVLEKAGGRSGHYRAE
jgi:cyclic pyranopterin monophosphate synthase